MGNFSITAVVSLTKYEKDANNKTVKTDGKSVTEATWKGTVTFDFSGEYSLQQFAQDSITNTTQSPVVKYASLHRPHLKADGSYKPPLRVDVSKLYKTKLVQVDPIQVIENSADNSFLKGLKARLANVTDPATRAGMEALIATLETPKLDQA